MENQVTSGAFLTIYFVHVIICLLEKFIFVHVFLFQVQYCASSLGGRISRLSRIN